MSPATPVDPIQILLVEDNEGGAIPASSSPDCREFMNWQEVRKLADSGLVDFGSHLGKL